MSKLTKRQLAADLIVAVLTGQLSVREALLKFPPNTFDKSIECAWHALMHFEADEDIRTRDDEYRQEQDAYLQFVAETLMDGKDLPINILQSYKKFHGGAPIPTDEKSFWSKLLAIFRFINLN